MAVFNVLFALLAVGVLCAFFAQKLQCNAALLPLPVLGGGVLVLYLFGLCGNLLLGGWAFYTLALAAGIWLCLKKQAKAACKRLAQPGFVLFLGASLVFLLFFAVQQPIFTQWDEFTFWGTAAKLTKTQNVLHPAAQGNLQAWSYQPALPLLSYLFQFFGTGFVEWAVYAAYACLHAACVGTIVAVFSPKRWSSAVVLAACGWLLPYVFTTPMLGGVSNIYATAMSDVLIGCVFGACLCLVFSAQRRPLRFVGLAVCLALLTLIKDMGLVYALIVAVIAAADYLFGQRFTPKRLGKAVLLGVCGCGVAVAGYFSWSKFASAAYGVSTGTVGSGTEEGGATLMESMLNGVKQLLGLAQRTEHFSEMLGKMAASPATVTVSLFGSGLFTTAVIFVILAVATLGMPKGERYRPAMLFVLGGIALVLFIVLHLFTYVFVFSELEALQLKDYARYIGPYYLGWAFAALSLLAKATKSEGFGGVLRLAGVGLLAGFCGIVALRGTPAAGFWNYPETLYCERQEVQQRVQAVAPYLTETDSVLLISQGDDATRWNLYGYELSTTLGRGYGGSGYNTPGSEHWPLTQMTLASPSDARANAFVSSTGCEPDDLLNFLLERRYTHLLVDISDDYFSDTIAPAFGVHNLPLYQNGEVYLIAVTYSETAMQWQIVYGGAV